MSKTPPTLLSDALTSFNKAATLAFTAAQDQARKDLTQATTDAREARRERDEAVNALHASRLEEQAWRQEAGAWKSAVREFSCINHHLETIAQLRQEASQWKNQCLRLEETSRQEAISWKDQFLRVEQERSKLSQRVEELVAEQLNSSGHAQVATAPYTPMARYTAIGDLSASARLQRASALDYSSPQEHPPSKSTSSVSKTTSNTNRTRLGPILQLPTPLSENQRSARQRDTQETAPPTFQPGLSSNSTRQILIRRVQAVVEVPVKEESVDREIVGSDTRVSTSTSNIASTSTSVSSAPKTSKALPRTTEPGKPNPRIQRKASAKRTYVEIDDEESERDDASKDPKQSDAEEYEPVSDGDDELLMGIETNRKEVYGMKRVPKPIPFPNTARPLVVAKKRNAPPPTKRSRPLTTSKP
ncbi:hypothetical protein J3R83DRAFT_12935 [Lanmaoa asiatica]|nr:hypothetical protein J3R83DRAFT_12935 [Lanmaoa asiatica]